MRNSPQRKKWISETLYSGYRQAFEIKRMIVDARSKYQHIQLFESTSHGKVLMIDGVVQLTELDEFIYHEMLVHVPLLSHPKPKKVLIIGGGDGGAARRALMHKNVSVTLVDIDPEIIMLSKKYLNSVSAGVFGNQRLTVVNGDGADFVATTSERFDVILTDRGDPIGAMEILFEKKYYQNCKRCLDEGGILASLTGVPFMQKKELSDSLSILQKIFKINTCYLVPVPTYVGGTLAVTWSSDTVDPRTLDLKKLALKSKKLLTKYYTPEIHKAAFVLPQNLSKFNLA